MARRCSQCGFAFNPDDSSSCSVCGASLQSGGMAPLEFAGRQPSAGSRQPGGSPGLEFQPQEQPRTSAPRAAPAQQRETGPGATGRVIRGRISHVQRHDERPPPDVFSVMSKIMIWILIIVPFGFLFIFTGAVSLAFAIVGLRALSHFFNPIIWATSLFEFFEIMVLARIRGSDQVPIYRGSLEDENGRQTFFVFRGPLNHGNLVQGNLVEFQGRDRMGTFVVRQGRDLSSNALISSHYRNPWRMIFCVLLLVFAGLIGIFFLVAWPELQHMHRL